MINPPSGVQVRRMAHTDLDRVIEIEQCQPSAPHWPRSAYLAAIDPQAELARIALVAEETGSGALAGFAVASLLPPQAELESIAVAPEFQRQGLATLLFTSLVAEFNSVGVNEVIIEVRASNQPALGFYRRWGFVRSGSRARYYTDPVEDAVLMTLKF